MNFGDIQMLNHNENNSRLYLPINYILYGKYRIVRILGAGGFGVTYEVYDMNTGVHYALKEFFPLKFACRAADRVTVESTNEDYFLCLQKFKKEAEMLMQLSSDNDILKIYHLFNFNNTIYYVMELLQGEDLKQRLSRGTLTWEEAEKLLSSLTISLDKLHSYNVIHRDITPDNIFILKDGSVKLIDFGSVRSIYNAKFTTALKEKFAPIEQFSDESKQGAYTDIYSLCVTIYYALSGVFPPKSVDRLIKDDIVNISEHCPALPKHVAKAIMKGLNVQAQDRYATVKEFSEDIFRTTPNMVTIFENKAVKFGLSELVGIAKKRFFHESKTVTISCVQGCFPNKNFKFKTGDAFSMGRNASCNIVFPHNANGISRQQCIFNFDGESLLLCDSSSYGTYVNGLLIGKDKTVKVQSGDTVHFAGEIFKVLY